MKVGAFDPSLTAVGCALLDDRPGAGGRAVVETRLLRPPSPGSMDVAEELTRRLGWIGESVLEVASEWDLAEAVVEVPELRPPRRLKGRRPTGQARYGAAVGSAVAGLVRWFEARADEGSDGRWPVYGVSPETWTGGRSKGERARLLGLTNPAAAAVVLASGSDGGLDKADAVELGLWWMGGGRLEFLARSA